MITDFLIILFFLSLLFYYPIKLQTKTLGGVAGVAAYVESETIDAVASAGVDLTVKGIEAATGQTKDQLIAKGKKVNIFPYFGICYIQVMLDFFIHSKLRIILG